MQPGIFTSLTGSYKGMRNSNIKATNFTVTSCTVVHYKY